VTRARRRRRRPNPYPCAPAPAPAFALALAALLCAAQAAGAFSITAQNRVENDIAEMLFVAEAQSPGRQGASADADTAIDWALSHRAAYPNVQMAASGPQAVQRYDSRSGRRTWLARRELRLESDNLRQLARLAGALLTRLKLSRARFKLSEKLRMKTELRLMAGAMKRFNNEKPQADMRPDSIEVTVDNLARTGALQIRTLLESGLPGADKLPPGHSIIRITLQAGA